MNVNIETPNALRRKLTIELEPAEINSELDRTYNELRRSVQLRGFRPGRAPRNLLEKFFGDQVRGDVLQKLIREYTGKALAENDLQPIVQPEIITEESDLKKAQLKFSAIFDLKPEFEVQDYAELKVQKSTVTVSDEEVASTLENLRERNGSLKKIEDRKVVADGDFVVATFEAFHEGKGVPDTKFADRIVRVAPNEPAHGLDEVLRGAEVGVEVRKERSYPEDYVEREVAGKTVEWRATVKDIYERVLPNLDDEFAKDQGQFQNLDELRAAIRKDLEAHAQQEADNRARQGLIDLVIERNPVEVPESLITAEQRTIEAEMANALESAGIPHEMAHQRAAENPEETRKRAEKRARSALVIDAIATKENIEVSDDEVAERIATMVTRGGRQRDRIAEFYRAEENREALKQVMRREKTIGVLMERAQKEEPAESASA
ncbi:MAG TPA: trigger factor [Candidatus Binataceae bacterium]|nr:trigger factor [Candidatus Binataceae bacterium]